MRAVPGGSVGSNRMVPADRSAVSHSLRRQRRGSAGDIAVWYDGLGPMPMPCASWRVVRSTESDTAGRQQAHARRTMSVLADGRRQHQEAAAHAAELGVGVPLAVHARNNVVALNVTDKQHRGAWRQAHQTTSGWRGRQLTATHPCNEGRA